MPQRKRIAAFIAALTLTSAASAGCEDYLQQTQQAADALDGEALTRLLPILTQQTDCSREYIDWVERVQSQAMINQAQYQYTEGDLVGAEQTLKQVENTSWYSKALHGKIAAARKDWGRAIAFYNEAVDLINDKAETKENPEDEEKEMLFSWAQEAQLLAETTKFSITRAGKPSGIMLGEIRGWKPEKWAVPVQFDTGKTRFTSKGEDSAQRLAALIKEKKPASITLVGHADERGDDADNLKLSLARAERLRDYLADQGVSVPIQADGKGEDEPFQPSAGRDEFTEEERWALDRRVEFQLD